MSKKAVKISQKESKITIHYHTLDADKINPDDLNQFGTDYRALFEFLKDYFIDHDVELSSTEDTIDLHQEAIVDIDLTPCKNFPNLTQVVLGYNPIILIDLSPLSECEKLENLFFDQCQTLFEIDLSPLSKCPNFKTITFRGDPIQKIDLSAFENSNLEWLELPHTFLSEVDLSPLANCQKLRYVAVDDNRLEQIDLAPLANCTNLTTLYLNMNRLKEIDLTPLETCKKLEDIHLNDNLYASLDLTPLASCPNLQKVLVDDVEIIAPEEGLPGLYKMERRSEE